MKFPIAALSCFLLSATSVVKAQTREERAAIQSCCDNLCQDACDWLDENPEVINPSAPVGTSTAVGGDGGRTRPNNRRQLQTLADENCCIGSGGGGGDPHIKTWTGTYFDYQGQCDLVLVHAPDFGEGIGLDVHIRTKTRQDFSYIESAAVRIGANDILEVGAWGEYLLNGVDHAQLNGVEMANAFPISHDAVSKKTHKFHIELGDGQSIKIQTFKDWVSVSLENATAKNFKASTGLMGHFFTGTKYARDGKTVLNDENMLGQEWQVRDTEPSLFASMDRYPQYPQQCVLPSEVAGVSRRLGETDITEEAAALACQHHEEETMRELCQYDVMAANDLERAEAGAF